MEYLNFYKSLTNEINALKNRVRDLISVKHWLTDGEWKESVIRTILKRFLPSNLKVGRGFIITPKSNSSQIDILIYHNHIPIIHQDGELVFVTPDSVAGIIEVKTKLRNQELFLTVDKLLNSVNLVTEATLGRQPFSGIFSYESERTDYKKVVDYLLSKSPKFNTCTINSIALGENDFIKYWDEIDAENRCVWNFYTMPGVASAYFVYNTIEYVCYPNSNFFSNQLGIKHDVLENFLKAKVSRFDLPQKAC